MIFKKKTLIISIVIVFVITAFLILKHLITYPLIHTEYNGRVTEYRFDIKGYSYFYINNKLPAFEMHHVNCDLKLGDSMVKKLDDEYIYHYRDKKLIGIYGVCFGGRYYWPSNK